MKLGVAGLLPDWQRIDAAATARVRAAGFKGAQWFFQWPIEADMAEVHRVQQAFREGGLEICQVNGWYEALVDKDEAIRAAGVQGISALTRLGAMLGTPSVFVRPGGLNPRGHWWPHPENHTLATFERLIDSLHQVSWVAETEGVRLAIEGHVLSPLNSAQRVRDLIDAVASPALKFNVDPVNFLGSVSAVYDTRTTLNELFDLLGPDMLAAHAKDVSLGETLVLHIDEVLLGTGTMDYELFLRQFEQYCPEGYILIEHLPNEKIPLARQALVAYADRAGVPLLF